MERSVWIKGASVFCVLVVMSTVFAVVFYEIEGRDEDESDVQLNIPAHQLDMSRPLTLDLEDSELPTIAIGMGDVVHVAWVRGGSGNQSIFYKRSTDKGRTFTPDFKLLAGIKEVAHVSSSSENSEMVALAWDGEISLNGSLSRYVFFLLSKDGGKSWSEPRILAEGWNPKIHLLSASLLITFLGPSDEKGKHVLRAVKISTSQDTTREAGPFFNFLVSGGSYATRIADGRLHVVWDEMRDHQTYLLHSFVDLESDKEADVTYVAFFDGNLDPSSISMRASGGALYLLWCDNRTGKYSINFARSDDSGFSWFPSGVLQGTDFDLKGTVFDINRTDILRALWQSNVMGPWQIYSAEISRWGSIVGEATRITQTSKEAVKPAIAIDSNDFVYGLWEDERRGNRDLYFDNDVFLSRPNIRGAIVYVNRLPSFYIRNQGEENKRELVRILSDVNGLIIHTEERGAARMLRNEFLPKIDGFRHGDKNDDLIVDERAQKHLWLLVNRLLKEIDPDPGDQSGHGTRKIDDILPPEDDPLPDMIIMSNSINWVYNVTTNTATIRWRIKLGAGWQVVSSWVDWWLPGAGSGREYDNSTPFQVVLTNLLAKRTYHYKIGAEISGIGQGSPITVFSPERTFFTGLEITWLRVLSVNRTSAEIFWVTNAKSTSVVHYGKDWNYNLTANGTDGKEHYVVLSNLTGSTTYYFWVKSVSTYDSNLTSRSSFRRFYTGLRITRLPEIETKLSPDEWKILIKWETNENATSVVHYGENRTLNQTATGQNGTQHRVFLTGLKLEKKYYFNVSSSAIANLNDTVDSTKPNFHTPEMTVVNFTVSEVGTSNATISWDTVVGYWGPEVNSTGHVDYGITNNESYNQTVQGSNGTHHNTQLTGLQSGETYHFRARSSPVSGEGSEKSIDNRSFTTVGISLNGSVWVGNVGAFQATVNWNTTINGSSVVYYYEYSGVGQSKYWKTATGENGTTHEVNLTGLSASMEYRYQVFSASATNAKDSVESQEYAFTTDFAPDDADSAQDAGNTVGSALQIVPGRFSAQVQSSLDENDYYKIWLAENQTLDVLLVPPSGFNLDLEIYDANQSLVDTSNNTGSSSENLSVETSDEGLWFVRIFLVSGSGTGHYNFTVNASGGGLKFYELDVGTPADGDYLSHLPGLSLDLSSGWSEVNTSETASTASWYEKDHLPNYRESSASSSFFFNLYENGPQKYTDYLLTFQYYSTVDVNVSFYNGVGWMVLGVLEGKSNWWTVSFVYSHTHFYDCSETMRGMNVLFRLSNVTQMNRMTAQAYAYTTYVGNGSDDQNEKYHIPGILLGNGWTNDGFAYKNGTSGAEVLLNIPENDTAYQVILNYNRSYADIWVDQFNGTSLVRLGKLYVNGTIVSFSTAVNEYADSNTTLPGENVRTTFSSAINQLTSIRMVMDGFQTAVGEEGDDSIMRNSPGLSLLTRNNTHWDNAIGVDGKTARQGDANASILLNGVMSECDYIVTVRYKVPSGNEDGEFQQYDGITWHKLGNIRADNLWHSDFFVVRSEWFSDYYGTSDLNIRLRFTTPVYLDALAAQPDQDLDGIGDFQETYGYWHKNLTSEVLEPQRGRTEEFWTDSPGRYQFEIFLLSNEEPVIRFYINGELKESEEDDDDSSYDGGDGGGGSKYLKHRGPDFGVVKTFNATLCYGVHYASVYNMGLLDLTVVSMERYRDQTDPANNDTDGDGLDDYKECCNISFPQGAYGAQGTDPLNQDTDFDGLTDFDEVYSFSYSDSTGWNVQGNESQELNFTVEGMGPYEFWISLSGTPDTGKNLTAQVFLDGMLKKRLGSNSSWSNWANFRSMLSRGFHILNFTIEEARGNLTINSIQIDRAYGLTDPRAWDSDDDKLGDGEELLGWTGWVLDPTDSDTDGDGRSDSFEIYEKQSDPTIKDTDGDGVDDFYDYDPLSDLVVQLYIEKWTIDEGASGNDEFFATAGVDGKWVITKITQGSQGTVHCNISVNVDDHAGTIPVNITLMKSTRDLVDISPYAGEKELTLEYVLGANRTSESSSGTEGSLYGTVYYSLVTIRTEKVNTLLIAPADYSTIHNVSTEVYGDIGIHRYLGEQKFIFVFLNVSDSSSNVFDIMLNTIIVPRGIFYRTQLYQLLNGSYVDIIGTALENLTVMGNENDNLSSMNSRTIQMVLYKNVTSAEAGEILDYLLQNESGEEAYIYIDITNEMYTIGFNQDVLNITPNEIIENSGNGTAPNKPEDDPPWWEAAWNSFCGFVSYAWDGITAAANYMVNLYKAVVEWGIGLVKAIADGSLFEEIKNKIVRPFVDALVAFVKWVIDWITSCLRAFLDPLIAPIKNAIDNFMVDLGSALVRTLIQYKNTGTIEDDAGKRAVNIMLGSFFWILTAISTAIVVAMVVLTYTTVVLSLVIGLLASIIVTVMLLALFGQSDFERTSVSPDFTPLTASGIFALARAYMKQNVHSPNDFTDMLGVMGLIFATQASMLNAMIVGASSDITGWLGLILGLVCGLMAIATTVWVYNHSPSAEVTELSLDMLSVVGIAWAFLALILSFVSLPKLLRVNSGLLPLAVTAVLFSSVGIFLGVYALTR